VQQALASCSAFDLMSSESFCAVMSVVFGCSRARDARSRLVPCARVPGEADRSPGAPARSRPRPRRECRDFDLVEAAKGSTEMLLAKVKRAYIHFLCLAGPGFFTAPRPTPGAVVSRRRSPAPSRGEGITGHDVMSVSIGGVGVFDRWDQAVRRPRWPFLLVQESRLPRPQLQSRGSCPWTAGSALRVDPLRQQAISNALERTEIWSGSVRFISRGAAASSRRRGRPCSHVPPRI